MKMQFNNREMFVLLVVSLMSFLANLPENFGGNLISRKLLLATLIMVTAVALCRYLKVLLLAIISILAVGANLPAEMAQALGISQVALLVSLGSVVALTGLNRAFHLLPTSTDGSQEENAVVFDEGNARQFVLAAISRGDIATLHALLDMKVAINFTYDGTTPLHLATEKGYSNIVKLLIDYGADFLAKNAEGKTPLDVALAKKKFVQTTEILFNATMPYIAKQPK